jgi:hypothetical protein
MRSAILVTACLVASGAAGCSRQESVWIAGWKETSPLTIPRAGAAIAQHGDFLYVIGGVDGVDFLGSMEFARIQKDGTVSAWKPGPSLNVPRGFLEAVVRDGWVYVVGGGNGPNGHNLLRSVERAKIQSDGSLGAWVLESSEMVVPRRCSKIVTVSGRLFSLGGFGGALLDSVESAGLNADGGVAAWQLDRETMTIPRYVNGVKAIGSDVYVIGGHDQNQGIGVTSVEWSRIDAGGSLGKWSVAQPMQLGRYALATATYDRFLYALGGITGAEYTASVERTTRDANGALGVWTSTTALPYPLSNFSAATHGKNIYIVGGTNLTGYYRSVQYATIDANGDIGFFGTKQEQSELKAKQEAASVIDLPNSGIVREVLHTSAYTYARVEQADGAMTWLAGPKTDLPLGARVRYSQGVYMTNFFSKELQRPFPEVTFVGTIAKD